MRTSERLLLRLRKDLPDLELPADAAIVRIRRGRHGKAAEAWAWTVHSATPHRNVGSAETMGECVRAPRLSWHVSRAQTIVVNAEGLS